MENQDNVEDNFQELYTALFSKTRINILGNLLAYGPMKYSNLGTKSGFDINAKKRESGKFAFHLRTLKKADLIDKKKNKIGENYNITEKGERAVIGICYIRGDIESDNLVNDINKTRDIMKKLVGTYKENDLSELEETKPIQESLAYRLSKTFDLNDNEIKLCKYLAGLTGNYFDLEDASKKLEWKSNKTYNMIKNLTEKGAVKKFSTYQEGNLVSFYKLNENVV